MREEFLELIGTRRVIRNMTDEPVEREQLEKVLEAGRWAPVAGNQRVQRFVVTQDPTTLRLLRMVSPGMAQRPQAAIVLCIDRDKVEATRSSPSDRSPYIDLGTTMQTMMLAAHAIGLGSGPVTSFAGEAVRVVLNLPSNLSPEVIICIGHPASGPQMPMRRERHERLSWHDLTRWERFEDQTV